MTVWYSNITNGFYDDTLPNMVVPAEAFTISDDHYANVVNGIASGFQITTDDTGNPIVSNLAAAPPIRVITSYSFVNRLTPTERATLVMAALAAIQQSPPDPTLAIFLDDLGAATLVNLDGNTIAYALAVVTEAGLIANGRMSELLVDGTFDESPEGPIAGS